MVSETFAMEKIYFAKNFLLRRFIAFIQRRPGGSPRIAHFIYLRLGEPKQMRKKAESI